MTRLVKVVTTKKEVKVWSMYVRFTRRKLIIKVDVCVRKKKKVKKNKEV